MANKKRIFTVLSIEGGGVRGIVPARILQELEERTGKPIAELFDMVGGTSTGAIIGGSLLVPDPANPAKPRFAAKDILNLYHKLAGKIFPEMSFKTLRKLSTGALYDPKPLEDALEMYFGEMKMRDTLKSLLIPTVDIKNFKPVWISHLKGKKDTSEAGWSTMKLRDAVRATTSAPTFFPAKYYETTPNEDMPNVRHRHALIDGSFIAGNAVRHLYAQAKKVAPPDAEIVIVYIGTGMNSNSLSPEEFNALGPLGLVSPANGSILLTLVTNIALMDGENDMQEELGEKFFSFDSMLNNDEDPDAPALQMDDARTENLQRLEKFAEGIIKERSKDIDRLCELLETREMAEQLYLESNSALQTLAEKLAATKSVKSLMTLYHRKIVLAGYEPTRRPPTVEEVELKDLADKLNETHRADLERIYHALLEQKKAQGKIMNKIKEAGEDITNVTKKIFIEPFTDTPDADNDNNPADKKSKEIKKKPPQP